MFLSNTCADYLHTLIIVVCKKNLSFLFCFKLDFSSLRTGFPPSVRALRKACSHATISVEYTIPTIYNNSLFLADYPCVNPNIFPAPFLF